MITPKFYQVCLVNFLWIAGIPLFAYSLYLALFIVPKTLTLYQEFGASAPYPGVILSYALPIFLLAQIIYAFNLKRKLKTSGPLTSRQLITVILLALSVLAWPAIVVVSALLPIYNLTSELK